MHNILQGVEATKLLEWTELAIVLFSSVSVPSEDVTD